VSGGAAQCPELVPVKQLLPLGSGMTHAAPIAMQQPVSHAGVAEAANPVFIDVAAEVVTKVASVMGTIKGMSNAQIELVAADGGLKLRLTGSPAQVQSALSLQSMALA